MVDRHIQAAIDGFDNMVNNVLIGGAADAAGGLLASLGSRENGSSRGSRDSSNSGNPISDLVASLGLGNVMSWGKESKLPESPNSEGMGLAQTSVSPVSYSTQGAKTLPKGVEHFSEGSLGGFAPLAVGAGSTNRGFGVDM